MDHIVNEAHTPVLRCVVEEFLQVYIYSSFISFIQVNRQFSPFVPFVQINGQFCDFHLTLLPVSAFSLPFSGLQQANESPDIPWKTLLYTSKPYAIRP